MNFISFLTTILAQDFQLPPPKAWTFDSITSEIFVPVVRFMVSVGVIGGVIAIVISGIMYMKAGSDTKAIDSAKAWFRNSVIGVFIVLAVYLIINTISLIVTGEFFG